VVHDPGDEFQDIPAGGGRPRPHAAGGPSRVGDLSDAHLDYSYFGWGYWSHAGYFMSGNIRDGFLRGEDVIQVGMGSWSYGEKYYQQARDDGTTIYHMNEIQRDGFKAVMDKVLARLEGKDLVYITLDIDVLDMAYVPATNSSEPTGLTPHEFLPQLRRLCAAKWIVGADFVEYNPYLDNNGMQSARMVRHLALACLGGIAMNALEMDPEYVQPQVTGQFLKGLGDVRQPPPA
jgi:arginase family enzyme